MLDVGLGVRLIVAAAPAPPIPAPPGKPPFPLSSSLRRCCSSWWFSNGNAHGRDTTTTTTSSRATRRRWWSDTEGSQEDYRSYSLEKDDNHDYEDEAAFFGFGWAGELLDESWFSKVFKTYGVLLPVMLTSMFAATGLKAFLMAMAIPLSQWAISFLIRRRKGNRDDRWMIFFKKNGRWRRPFQEEEYPEDATDSATGGRGNGYSSSSNYYEGRRRRHNYQSWVSKDFVDAASTAVGPDDNTESSSSGDGGGNKSSGGYGGWDELLDNNTAAAQEAKRSSNSYSQLATLITARNRVLQRLGRKMPIITAAGGGRRVEKGVGAPPERMRMRRRRMPRTMGLGSTRYKQAPPLMRLLVAVFPFLGSWSRLL